MWMVAWGKFSLLSITVSSKGFRPVLWFYSSHVQMGELHIKKAECQRIDTFKLWSWRRLFKNPLDRKEIE